MSRMIKAEYDLGEKVQIVAIERTGRITGVTFDQEGTAYRVVYWDDGQRENVWMFDWELAPIEPA